jgi:hypothetical protein
VALENPSAALLYVDATAFLRSFEKVPHPRNALSLSVKLQDLPAAQLLHALR